MEMTRREMLATLMRGGAVLGGCCAAKRFMFLDLLAEDAADPAPFQIARAEYAAEKGRMLSRLGFGMMRLPMKNGDVDPELADPMIDYAYRHGVNYFDSAWFYLGGKSQTYMGKVLEKYDRESLFMVNKMPGDRAGRGVDCAKETFQRQLDAGRTKYFDNYLCHAIGNRHHFNDAYIKGKVIDYLRSEREAGRIRHLGFSFHGGIDDMKYFMEIKDKIGWEFVMLQLNANDWRGDGRKFYEIVVQAGLPIIVMEPLHGGRLANFNVAVRSKLNELKPGLSPAGWALRFVSSLPNVAVALSGMGKMSDVVDNVNTFKNYEPLSEEDRKAYYDICAKYSAGKNLIGCTGCEYCIPCPSHVAIPSVFGLVNTFRIEGLLGPNGDGVGMKPEDRKKFLIAYKNKVGTASDAARCTGCGVCMPKCPQHVKIADEMRKIVAIVDTVKKGR